MRPDVRLTPRAEADLEDIWRYSAEVWGKSRAETYLRTIIGHIESLASVQTLGRDCSDIREGYRRLNAGSHILFYRLEADGPIIVRVLHQRMDVTRQLGPDLAGETD
ncbi:MAG: type II toxin-antitoxin system RelE/ParE family toxin [Elsteraceae bacterium]